MNQEKISLWTDEEKTAGSGSAFGTFTSCDPALYAYPAEKGYGRGTVIVCPGGGYGGKAAHEGEPVARWLNSLQINAYVLDYRVNPDLHPAPISDVRRAISIARTRAADQGHKTDKIAVLGFSAGGHLAACAATMWPDQDSRPDAAILCYPVISFGKFGHIGSRANLLGETATSALISDMSVENRVDRQTPPIFLWHTANDEGVPVENTLLMASALAGKKIPFACHIFPDGRHGLGLAEDHETTGKWRELCQLFLQEQAF